MCDEGIWFAHRDYLALISVEDEHLGYRFAAIVLQLQ